MYLRTHLLFAFFLSLIFIDYSTYKILFIPFVLLFALLPDIDSRFSSVGSKWYFRPLQFFVKHRGILHSFTFGIFFLIVFYFLLPILFLPFLIGYFSHLFLDLITINGIEPLYPFWRNFSGFVRTGGIFENIFFFFLIFLNVILISFSLKLF